MTADDFNSDEVESTQNFAEALVEDQNSGLDARDIAAIEALPAGHALLIITRGYEEGSRFLIDSDVTLVGRHPTQTPARAYSSMIYQTRTSSRPTPKLLLFTSKSPTACPCFAAGGT